MGYLKAIRYLSKKILLPTFVILGNFVALLYATLVMMLDNNNSLLTIVLVAAMIASYIIAMYFGNYMSSSGLSSVVSSEPQLELVLQKDGRIELREKENVGLLVSAILGLLLSLIGIPLFLIGSIRAMISSNIRKMYANASIEMFNDGNADKVKKAKITMVVCFVIIFIMIALAIYIHLSKGIDLLSFFKSKY